MDIEKSRFTTCQEGAPHILQIDFPNNRDTLKQQFSFPYPSSCREKFNPVRVSSSILSLHFILHLFRYHKIPNILLCQSKAFFLSCKGSSVREVEEVVDESQFVPLKNVPREVHGNVQGVLYRNVIETVTFEPTVKLIFQYAQIHLVRQTKQFVHCLL